MFTKACSDSPHRQSDSIAALTIDLASLLRGKSRRRKVMPYITIAQRSGTEVPPSEFESGWTQASGHDEPFGLDTYRSEVEQRTRRSSLPRTVSMQSTDVRRTSRTHTVGLTDFFLVDEEQPPMPSLPPGLRSELDTSVVANRPGSLSLVSSATEAPPAAWSFPSPATPPSARTRTPPPLYPALTRRPPSSVPTWPSDLEKSMLPIFPPYATMTRPGSANKYDERDQKLCCIGTSGPARLWLLALLLLMGALSFSFPLERAHASARLSVGPNGCCRAVVAEKRCNVDGVSSVRSVRVRAGRHHCTGQERCCGHSTGS